ncbi:MAG TPA: hypothetical protein ENN49_10465 [Bacteroidales bacterium]|nr:hypothetical protein [Bacteroidales bacterium]
MKKNSMIALLMAGMFAFVACDKDDTKNLNKDEAQQQITNAEQELIAKSGEIVATDGYKIQEYFATQLPSPFYSKSNVLKSVVPSNFQKAYELTRESLLLENPEIDFYFEHFILWFFNDVKGTWNWTPNGWTHETTPTDNVVVKFPYPAGNASNNVTVTYYDFSSTLVDGQTVPTDIKVKIEYNNTQVFTLAYSATIANIEKFSTKVDVTFSPFAISNEESIDVSVNDKVLYSKKFTFKKDGKLFYSEDANLTITILNEESADVLITAKMVIGNLEFRLKIEANTNEFETGNPNDIVLLSLYTTGGDKVGDFVFVEEERDWVLYFKFNSGEQVKAETLMPLVSERFFSFIDDLFSNISEN